MEQAITAYCHVAASDELKELERLRSLARHNEASALRYASDKATKKAEKAADKKLKRVVAEKDKVLAEKDKALAEKDALITELQAKLAP